MVATLQALKDSGDRGIMALVEVKAGEVLTSWTKTSGRSYTWETTPTQDASRYNLRTFDAVKVDGSALTTQASIANVDANAGSFYWDGTKLYIHTADSSTVYTHTVIGDFTLYLSTGSDDGTPVVFNSNQYWPLVAELTPVTRQIDDPHEAQSLETRISVGVSAGDLWDTVIRSWRWDNRAITILIGGEDLTYGEYQTVFTGVIGDVAWRDNGITFLAVDAIDKLDRSFGFTTYATTDHTATHTFTWPPQPSFTVSKAPSTLGDNLSSPGDYKPVCYGRYETAEPQPIARDTDEGIYQVSGHTLLEILSVTVESASAKVTVSNTSTDTSNFWWAQDLTNGRIYVKTTDSTDLTISTVTCDVRGKPHASLSEVVMDNPAEIIEDVIDTIGLGSKDSTSFTESTFLCSVYEASLYAKDDSTTRNALNTLQRTAGSWLFVTSAGDWKLKPWVPDLRSTTAIEEVRGDVQAFAASTRMAEGYPEALVEYALDETVPMVEKATNTAHQTEAGTDKNLRIVGTAMKNRAGAACLAWRTTFYSMTAPWYVPMQASHRVLDLEPGDFVTVTKARLPIADSTTTFHAQVQSVAVDLDGVSLVLAADRHVGRFAFIGPAGAAAWGSATAEQKRTRGFWTEETGLIDSTDNGSYQQSLYF